MTVTGAPARARPALICRWPSLIAPLAPTVSLWTVASSWAGRQPGPPWLAAPSQAWRGGPATAGCRRASLFQARESSSRACRSARRRGGGGGGGAGGEPLLEGLVVPLDLAAGLRVVGAGPDDPRAQGGHGAGEGALGAGRPAGGRGG